MIDEDEFVDDSNHSDEEDVQKLKEALFEICKTEYDRSSALDKLINDYGPLVVDVFSDNPFETMPALEDFYEYNDYTDPDTGEWRTFADWSEYFAGQDRREFAPLVFEMLKSNCSIKEIFQKLKDENNDLVYSIGLSSVDDLKSYMEDENYEDDFLYIEQTLLEWEEFFKNDEFGLYNTCIDLTDQNETLKQKLQDIKDIIDKTA